MSEILQAQVAVSCPKCDRSFQVMLDDIHRERVVRCPTGHEIQLKESGDGISSADRALDEFKRSIERMNLKLRI